MWIKSVMTDGINCCLFLSHMNHHRMSILKKKKLIFIIIYHKLFWNHWKLALGKLGTLKTHGKPKKCNRYIIKKKEICPTLKP